MLGKNHTTTRRVSVKYTWVPNGSTLARLVPRYRGPVATSARVHTSYCVSLLGNTVPAHAIIDDLYYTSLYCTDVSGCTQTLATSCLLYYGVWLAGVASRYHVGRLLGVLKDRCPGGLTVLLQGVRKHEAPTGREVCCFDTRARTET